MTIDPTYKEVRAHYRANSEDIDPLISRVEAVASQTLMPMVVGLSMDSNRKSSSITAIAADEGVHYELEISLTKFDTAEELQSDIDAKVEASHKDRTLEQQISDAIYLLQEILVDRVAEIRKE